jgi:hypothetical protein
VNVFAVQIPKFISYSINWYITLFTINKNTISIINAPTAAAILQSHVLLITIKGTVELNIRTKRCTVKVRRVRFKNFSNAFCFTAAIFELSIYFVSAWICQIILAIIQNTVYALREIVV